MIDRPAKCLLQVPSSGPVTVLTGRSSRSCRYIVFVLSSRHRACTHTINTTHMTRKDMSFTGAGEVIYKPLTLATGEKQWGILRWTIYVIICTYMLVITHICASIYVGYCTYMLEITRTCVSVFPHFGSNGSKNEFSLDIFTGSTNAERRLSSRHYESTMYDLIRPESFNQYMNCTSIDNDPDKILETVTIPF